MGRAISRASEMVIIRQNEKEIEIKIAYRNKNKNNGYKYTAPLDGTRITYKDHLWNKFESRTTVSRNKRQLIEKSVHIKKQKKYETTRWMENGEMKLRIVNDKGVSWVLTYERYEGGEACCVVL